VRSGVIERNMFYGASRNTFNKAHELRRIMTDAEKSLWKELKNRKIFKSRFRRQHPVDIFIVDFYCHEFKLAIEIDGEIHLNQEVAEYDDGRTHDLEKLGIRILRFTNQQVFTDMNTILREILQFVSSSNPL
jgi:very-short-patch-repair endonuclease